MAYGPDDVASALRRIADSQAGFFVRAELEQHLLTLLAADGVDAVIDLLERVPGFEFVRAAAGESPGLTVLVAAVKTGACAVELHKTEGVISVNVGLRAGAGARAVQERPDHAWFYSHWERLMASDALDHLDALAPCEKSVALVALLEAEVMNGGLGQYLANSEGRYIAETLRCLEQIGAARTRAVLAAASALGQPDMPYQEVWENFQGQLEALDEQFLATREDLAGLVAAACRNKTNDATD